MSGLNQVVYGTAFYVVVGVVEWQRVAYSEEVSSYLSLTVSIAVSVFLLLGVFLNWLGKEMWNSADFKKDFGDSHNSFIESAMEAGPDAKIKGTQNAMLVVCLIIYLSVMTPLMKNGEVITAMIMMYAMILVHTGLNRLLKVYEREIDIILAEQKLKEQKDEDDTGTS